MTTAEDLGRMSYHSGSEKCQQIRELHIRQIEADMNSRREMCELKIKLASSEEKRVTGELASRGNISQEVMRENIWRAGWAILLLSLCVPGEFVFAVWTVICFGLGRVESILVAIAIVILSLECVDFCLESLRKHYRSFDNQILMVFAHFLTRIGLNAMRGSRIIVRILVLPRHVDCCHDPALEMLSECRDDCWVSILDQYIPKHQAYLDPGLSRRPTKEEISEVESLVDIYGLRNIAKGCDDF